jgi:cell division protein FtsL
MTVRPLRTVERRPALAVLVGNRRRPVMGPWLVFSVLAVTSFLGLVFTRTALDRNAFELAEVERTISENASLNQRLRLEIAALESPSRIAPLAVEMGMLAPDQRTRLVVERIDREAPKTDPRWAGIDRLAAASLDGMP